MRALAAASGFGYTAQAGPHHPAGFAV